MSKTVSLSLSGRKRQFLVGAVVTVFFFGPVVAAGLSVLGLTVLQSFGVAIGGGLALTTVWVWKRGGNTDDGSAWDAIPEWQYNGRFAEAGGLTRSEQEAAIEDLQERE
ncbi:hypothetical protein HISP_08765 [Haloarcula hispanica N601]|uniref:Uncharacterized protein n=3 Tax=Haloarcula hispanica TaxID=51589 RepID=A0A482T5G2_HALHI|nr:MULTISPECIES: hypothetical protein [Haloarcula]AEM57319.1 hypothetical protein HAH_1717 [Haloarcula hispanica ATCC 33960]AHB67493.1 hypothetical protein HISP_08765 [Haloarcula hispanica N601]KAA9409987.1 hypothetical protein EGO51_09295 [Haloarcula hispanica]MCJ0619010.1 hypothetical protein [Haloarcula hispanica]MUV48680.1 hypothetical protein [Haloarcula sp. CBA1122]